MTGFHDPETLFAAVSNGDPAARERAILNHVPLVRSIARRHLRPPETLDELVQVGTVALIGAVDRYDPRRGGSFASFAVPTITGEIQRHYRDRVGVVRLPRSVVEARHAAVAATDALRQDAGHDPDAGEIAGATGLSTAQVREALAAPGISRPLPYWAEDGGEDAPAGRLGDDDPGYLAAEARADLSDAVAALPAREQTILQLRYREDLTQTEIADRVGVSQMHVSRLLRRAIGVLRDDLGVETAGAAAT